MQLMFGLNFLLLICFSTASYTPVCNTAPSQYCHLDNCNIWYVDSMHGTSNGDGSSSNPWIDFGTALLQLNSSTVKSSPYTGPVPIPSDQLQPTNPHGKIQPGDVIVLRSGNYGQIYVRALYNSLPVTVMGEPGAVPIIDTFKMVSSSNWIIRCLNVTSTSPNLYMNLVDIEGSSFLGPLYDCLFTENSVYSYMDLEYYRNKNQTYIYNDTATGIYTRSAYTLTISKNYIYHVRFGIVCMSPNTVMSHNVINYVTIDGFDILNNDTVIEFNRIMNSMNVDNGGFHRDGIQLFTNGDIGTLSNITIRNNVFMADQDKNRPFADGFQGISAYDVPIYNVVVENNLVTSIKNYNGIALYKAINCRIVSNTVMDLSDAPFSLWITTRHGVSGNIIQNNIAREINAMDGATTVNSNAVKKWTMDDLRSFFVDPDNFDMRLKDNGSSPFIGQGNSTNSPIIDNDGNIRGGDYDIGCYAFHPISPPNVDPSQSPSSSDSPTSSSSPMTGSDSPSSNVSSGSVTSTIVNAFFIAVVLLS